MKKIIEINIKDELDLYEKYNKKLASRDLINYLVENALFSKSKDKLKIIINSNLENNKDIGKIIKETLRAEYENLNYKYNRNSIIQAIYLILGVIVLFLSTLIAETVLKEVVLIVGWIFIWTMMELEIFSDKDIKTRRKAILKLIKSDFVEVKEQ